MNSAEESQADAGPSTSPSTPTSNLGCSNPISTSQPSSPAASVSQTGASSQLDTAAAAVATSTKTSIVAAAVSTKTIASHAHGRALSRQKTSLSVSLAAAAAVASSAAAAAPAGPAAASTIAGPRIVKTAKSSTTATRDIATAVPCQTETPSSAEPMPGLASSGDAGTSGALPSMAAPSKVPPGTTNARSKPASPMPPQGKPPPSAAMSVQHRPVGHAPASIPSQPALQQAAKAANSAPTPSTVQSKQQLPLHTEGTQATQQPKPIHRQQITININSLTGKSFQMSLSNTHTIGDLKLCIARDHGIPYESQRLVFRDKTLGPDEAVLASFGLQTGSSLYLVLHMAGGPGPPLKTAVKPVTPLVLLPDDEDHVVFLLCKQNDDVFMLEVHLRDTGSGGRTAVAAKHVLKLVDGGGPAGVGGSGNGVLGVAGLSGGARILQCFDSSECFEVGELGDFDIDLVAEDEEGDEEYDEEDEEEDEDGDDDDDEEQEEEEDDDDDGGKGERILHHRHRKHGGMRSEDSDHLDDEDLENAYLEGSATEMSREFRHRHRLGGGARHVSYSHKRPESSDSAVSAQAFMSMLSGNHSCDGHPADPSGYGNRCSLKHAPNRDDALTPSDPLVLMPSKASTASSSSRPYSPISSLSGSRLSSRDGSSIISKGQRLRRQIIQQHETDRRMYRLTESVGTSIDSHDADTAGDDDDDDDAQSTSTSATAAALADLLYDAEIVFAAHEGLDAPRFRLRTPKRRRSAAGQRADNGHDGRATSAAVSREHGGRAGSGGKRCKLKTRPATAISIMRLPAGAKPMFIIPKTRPASADMPADRAVACSLLPSRTCRDSCVDGAGCGAHAVGDAVDQGGETGVDGTNKTHGARMRAPKKVAASRKRDHERDKEAMRDLDKRAMTAMASAANAAAAAIKAAGRVIEMVSRDPDLHMRNSPVPASITSVSRTPSRAAGRRLRGAGSETGGAGLMQLPRPPSNSKTLAAGSKMAGVTASLESPLSSPGLADVASSHELGEQVMEFRSLPSLPDVGRSAAPRSHARLPPSTDPRSISRASSRCESTTTTGMLTSLASSETRHAVGVPSRHPSHPYPSSKKTTTSTASASSAATLTPRRLISTSSITSLASTSSLSPQQTRTSSRRRSLQPSPPLPLRTSHNHFSSAPLLLKPTSSSSAAIPSSRRSARRRPLAASTSAIAPSIPQSSASGPSSSVSLPSKCSICKKRLGPATTFKCRCNDVFCAAHRYSDRHDCSFDYKEAGKAALARENPLVKKDKVLRI